MAKFSGTNRALRTNLTAPIRTLRTRALTYERGVGYSRDAESDLFLLAVTNMVGEDTFYESADVRDKRYRDLVHAVAVTDPDWMLGS